MMFIIHCFEKPWGLIQRKEARNFLPKNDGARSDSFSARRIHDQPAGAATMNITLNGTLQFLAFSTATLLATVILVFAGLNENRPEERNLASMSSTAKDPR
jgi:hypothetical protein